MRLEHVKLAPGDFLFEVGVVVCRGCGVPLRYAEAYADLDGPIERSFYCGPCAGWCSPGEAEPLSIRES